LNRRIALALSGAVVVLLGLWLATLPFGSVSPTVFAMRPVFLQGSGTLAIGLMSVAMVLATRPMTVEPWFGGLDKMYRLHKWLGIGALGLAIVHWLWVEAPKWLVDLGWLVRPPRVPAAAPSQPVLQQLHALRGAAEAVGEWAFYATVVFIGLALIERFPYRRFFQTHRVLPVVYLALVFHSVVLTQDSSWSQPLGVAMALLMAAGSAAALLVLAGRVGRGRQAVAVIDALEPLPGVGVLGVTAHLKSRWPGHAAGQFAFVRFEASEGAHPFTITSDWSGDGRIEFLIKGLGDYTRALPQRLKIGDLLRVEGPYGCFDFSSTHSRQIWVGGGIGITPFIARLAALAAHPDGRSIDLFHTSADRDDRAFARLRAAASAAHVRLHLMVDAVDGRLSAERVCEQVPDWRAADVWFCGPAGFGRSLRSGLVAKGMARTDFHQEFFNLR
jgi:predicted ferric reductase